MAKKLYEESNIAAIAEKIRSRTGGDKKYTVAKMADGVDDAAEVAAEVAAEEKEAITRGLIERNLTEIVIPKGVKEIGPYALAGLSKCGIYDFSNFDSVPPLSYEGFYGGCYGKIYVPASLYDQWIKATNWATYADYIVPKASEGLTITYGDAWGMDAEQYTVIGRGDCTDSFVVIPEKYDDGIHGELEVKEIAYYVFSQDDTLTAIYIPKTITVMWTDPVAGCRTLKKIYLPGVTATASIVLCGLTSLEYVKFGSELTDIGGGTFGGCAAGAVYDFTACESVPTLDSYGVGEEFGTEPVIKVPASLYEEWKAATNWTLYEDYIVAAE